MAVKAGWQAVQGSVRLPVLPAQTGCEPRDPCRTAPFPFRNRLLLLRRPDKSYGTTGGARAGQSSHRIYRAYEEAAAGFGTEKERYGRDRAARIRFAQAARVGARSPGRPANQP